ncbi:MAG: hypothetical protein C4291_15845 [Candidatus Dadabacteria bacterium]
MRLAFSLCSLLALVLLSQCAPLSPPGVYPVSYPVIHSRIAELQRRIDNGVARGTLTDEEASRLQFRLDKIRSDTERLEAEGIKTPEEAARLNQKLDILENDIYRLKHNPRGEYY